ncbi:hypothetical protein HPB52_021121 [Rhipicephalus sanguineus]|uniref:Uncharacterized protein n=1 Tax=Rhipicephalus sanguineus TaxID=34632 RepID=A0A9D4PSD7_RHISA|nr:hypothetical protein HPB52_021121 [Rhipicephalus sanguineus]
MSYENEVCATGIGQAKKTSVGRRRSFAVAVQKKHIESLRNKYQGLHQALETTKHDSMALFWEHHGVMDKAVYMSVLPASSSSSHPYTPHRAGKEEIMKLIKAKDHISQMLALQRTHYKAVKFDFETALFNSAICKLQYIA